MELKKGQIYKNKTWRFLLPVLRGHGDIFTKKFNQLFKLGSFIHDTLLDGSEISNGRTIYIIFDKKYKEKEFYNFLDWIKTTEIYKGDYCPDLDLKKSYKHVIILTIPKHFHNSYDEFLKGRYSKMYDKKTANILFNSVQRIEDYYILTKNYKAFDNYIKILQKEFNMKIEDESKFIHDEYELPLKKKEEILNYKDGETVYFNEKLDKKWIN